MQGINVSLEQHRRAFCPNDAIKKEGEAQWMQALPAKKNAPEWKRSFALELQGINVSLEQHRRAFCPNDAIWKQGEA